MSAFLDLEVESRSVRRAREWVVDQLESLGRADLRHAAALGVSELVTNALLHASPPVRVQMSGTSDRPRVEVYDASSSPPTMRDMSHDGRATATVGRGLGIVGTYSHAWGAELTGDGKVVWFEPAVDPGQTAARRSPGEVFHVDAPPSGSSNESLVLVRLLGLPTPLFLHYRIWFEEMRRELRLLTLTRRTDNPLAVELSDLTMVVERERGRAVGLDKFDALVSGLSFVDLEFQVTRAMTEAMGRLLVLLEQLDHAYDEQLLTPAPGAEVAELRRWYHQEFERQGRGRSARPWAGSLRE